MKLMYTNNFNTIKIKIKIAYRHNYNWFKNYDENEVEIICVDQDKKKIINLLLKCTFIGVS